MWSASGHELEMLVSAYRTRRTRDEGRDEETDHLSICSAHSISAGVEAAITEPSVGISDPLMPLQSRALGTPGAVL